MSRVSFFPGYEPLPLSHPGDASEREADRAADAIAAGGSATASSFSSAPAPAQRSYVSAADAERNATALLPDQGRPLDPGATSSLGERFGYDFSAVRVHDDAGTASVAAALGAHAFTLGRHVAFATGRYDPATPDGERLLAHELAHVAQQERTPAARGVVHRYAAYSAADQSAGSSLGWVHPTAGPLRVSDDGLMVVEGNDWGPGSNKRAWTTPALVASANGVLSAQGSRANLRAKSGGTPLSGTAPETGAASTLTEIEPFNPAGGTFNLAADCGHACRQVMGSGGRDVATLTRPPDPGSAGTGGAVAGGIIGGLLGAGAGIGLGFLAGGVIGAVIGGIVGAIGGAIGGAEAGRAIARRDPRPAREEYLTPRDYYGGDIAAGGSTHTAEDWTEELLRREFGGSREEAYARYMALTPSQRDEFDRTHGINRYARPRVGQGQTISTEYDMPGFAYHPGMQADTWNFHYAATVLTSGDDHVTLESAYGWSPTDWIFHMYGPPRRGQSFHEEHAGTLTHGTRHMTYVVQPERLLDVTTIRETDLQANGHAVRLAVGTRLRVIERRPGSGGAERLLVRVVAGPHAGTTGTVAGADVR